MCVVEARSQQTPGPLGSGVGPCVAAPCSVAPYMRREGQKQRWNIEHKNTRECEADEREHGHAHEHSPTDAGAHRYQTLGARRGYLQGHLMGTASKG